MTDLISREAVCKIVADRVTDKFEKKAACHGIRALPAVKKSLTADPLTDPLVKALVEAARKIDSNYVGDCECDECCLTRIDLSAALRAIGGEA